MPYFRVLRKDIYYYYGFYEAENPEDAMEKMEVDSDADENAITDRDCDEEFICDLEDELTKEEFDKKDCDATKEVPTEEKQLLVENVIINHKCHPFYDGFCLEKEGDMWYLCCYECQEHLLKVGTLEKL